MGRYEDSLRQARDLVRLEPNSPNWQLGLANAAMTANRVDEAQTIVKSIHTGRLFELEQIQYNLAFLRGDAAEMEKILSAVGSDSENAPLFLHNHAYTEAYLGRIQSVRDLDRRAAKILSTWSDRQSADSWEQSFVLENAVLEVEFGYVDRGRRAVAALLAKSKALGNDDGRGGLALARAGDEQRARILAEQYTKKNPNSTLLKYYWLPTIRAASLLAEHKPAEAVRELEITSNVELGNALDYYTAPLYPVYLRGQAFLAMNRGREAAAEFQKFADNPGVVKNYPLAALARLGAARASALQGDTAKARDAYRYFLKLWKDADPDIPILKQAKAEYAKLQ